MRITKSGSDTLRLQLLKWLLIPMSVLMLINIGLFYKFGYDSANHRHDRYLSDVSKVLVDQLRIKNDKVIFNRKSAALSLLTEDKSDKVYFFLKGEGYSFGNPDLPLPKRGLENSPEYYLDEYAGKPMRLSAAYLPDPYVTGGVVLVVVAKSLNLHEERTQEWAWRVLPAQLVLFLLVGITVWWGVGRGLRPLLQMRDEMASRSPKDMSPLAEDKVVAEVRPLIHGFNELLGHLNESMSLQQRFVADAAHQLRTPLAGLKVQTELALSQSDPEELRHSLKQMHHAMEQTVHLTKQLLSLARAEPGAQSQSSMQAFDLSNLVKETTKHWVQTALLKNIDLGYEGLSEARLPMFGNRFLVAEMLNNLIDNALRYTQEGGRVTVRVMRDKGRLIIEVEDNGGGIPANLRQRVFERFYRVLGSDQSGCGLGLSIVWEIINHHAGDVIITEGAQGQGSLFRVSFPEIKREATRLP